jgi:hypothetical protein
MPQAAIGSGRPLLEKREKWRTPQLFRSTLRRRSAFMLRRDAGPPPPPLRYGKTATEKAGLGATLSSCDNIRHTAIAAGGHFLKSARSGAPLSCFARRSDAGPRYTPREIWSTRQPGSRTYERTRTNQEVRCQPTGAKTQRHARVASAHTSSVTRLQIMVLGW